MLVLGILIGLLVLVALVSVHEFGHAIAARRNGVVVEEFGIGFPPKAWTKKLKSGMVFSLNWLPIGGFVKLQGENDAASKKGDYGAATFWQKTKILLAGVGVNWLVAIILLMALAWTSGIPKIVENQFTVASDTTVVTSPVQLSSLVEGYPAEKSGLEAGDTIVRFAGTPITSSQQIIDSSKAHRGSTVPVVYERDGQRATVEVKLRDADSATFGASLGQQEALKSTWSAPIVATFTTAQYTWVTVQGLGDLVYNFFGGLIGQLTLNLEARHQASVQLETAGASVAGPVGILAVIFPAASQAGPQQIVFLAAIISLTLAVMNTLPIPALDGGRWFATALFKVLKKPLTKDTEERIHGTGFMVLMVLVVVITVADVTKLF